MDTSICSSQSSTRISFIDTAAVQLISHIYPNQAVWGLDINIATHSSYRQYSATHAPSACIAYTNQNLAQNVLHIAHEIIGIRSYGGYFPSLLSVQESQHLCCK